MQTNPQLENQVHELGTALNRLGEALQRDANADPLVMDATLQRFAFSFELTEKALQSALREKEGIDAPSARQALQKAYSVGWVSDQDLWWVDMQHARNLAAQCYQDDVAQDVYRRIQSYYPHMQHLYQRMADMLANMPAVRNADYPHTRALSH